MAGSESRKNNAVVGKAAADKAGSSPLTVSRPELLVDGSDREFRKLVHNLFAFLARHEAVRAGHAARIGLVGIEYTTLISIGHLSIDGDVSVNRVADHLHLSGAFVTTVTNKLASRKLIHKTPDPVDRRRVRLQVSEEGRRRLAELAPVQRQVNDVQFESLSAKEFRQLTDIIEGLIECGDRAVRLQAYLASDGPIGVMPSAVSKTARGSKPARRRA